MASSSVVAHWPTLLRASQLNSLSCIGDTRGGGGCWDGGVALRRVHREDEINLFMEEGRVPAAPLNTTAATSASLHPCHPPSGFVSSRFGSAPGNSTEMSSSRHPHPPVLTISPAGSALVGLVAMFVRWCSFRQGDRVAAGSVTLEYMLVPVRSRVEQKRKSIEREQNKTRVFL